MKTETYADWKSKVLALLKELPPHLKEKALRYAEHSTMHSDDFKHCEVNRVSEALFFAFPFVGTEEGFDWWFEECEKLDFDL